MIHYEHAVVELDIKAAFRHEFRRMEYKNNVDAAELMPVATATAKGLMSADDKKQGFKVYHIGMQKSPCYKIPGALWKRVVGFTFTSFNGGVQFVAFSFYKQNSKTNAKAYKVCGAEDKIKIYYDNDNLYIKNVTSGVTDSELYILSSVGSEYIGEDIIDDTYTEVPIE